jgi:hypothetical protein
VETDDPIPMIRLAVSPAAFEAIAALPLGSVGYEPEGDARGEGLIWDRGGCRRSPQGHAQARREL